MAILKFKTRGRPLTLDTEAVTEEIFARLPRARQTLKEFRQTTSGVRDEEIIGTETSLPEWLDASIMALTQFEDKITLASARDIKQALNVVRKLSSQRVSTREIALESKLTSEYLKGLESATKQSDTGAGKYYKKIEKYIKQASKKERVEYYKSRSYQDVGSFRNRRYQRIKAWAEDSTGRKMSYKESYAYLVARRLEDGLETAEEIKEDAGDLLFGE